MTLTPLVKHQDVVYEDQAVYVTGSGYTGCEFRRCQMVVRGFPFHFEAGCQFNNCIWDISFVLLNREEMVSLLNFLTQFQPSMPSLLDLQPAHSSAGQPAAGQPAAGSTDASAPPSAPPPSA